MRENLGHYYSEPPPKTEHSPMFPRCSKHWMGRETHAPSPQKVTTLWSHCSSLATKNLGQCWVTVDYVDLDPIDLGCSESQTYDSTNPGLNVLFCNDILRITKNPRKDATSPTTNISTGPRGKKKHHNKQV